MMTEQQRLDAYDIQLNAIDEELKKSNITAEWREVLEAEKRKATINRQKLSEQMENRKELERSLGIEGKDASKNSEKKSEANKLGQERQIEREK